MSEVSDRRAPAGAYSLMKSAAAIENGSARHERDQRDHDGPVHDGGDPERADLGPLRAGDEVEAVLAERRQALLEQEPADEDEQRQRHEARRGAEAAVDAVGPLAPVDDAPRAARAVGASSITAMALPICRLPPNQNEYLDQLGGNTSEDQWQGCNYREQDRPNDLRPGAGQRDGAIRTISVLSTEIVNFRGEPFP